MKPQPEAHLPEHEPMDLETIRQRLRSAQGRHFWRSLDEMVDADGFQETMRAEAPEQAKWLDSILDNPSRRTFLKLMGASLAMAGLAGCVPRRRNEKIVPYVQQPERIVPGKPLFFASASSLGGYATGVLVESHEGRPTKIEGNPEHPASLGATDAITQARILDMYDPDRSQVVLRNGEISTWGSFAEGLSTQLDNPNLGLRVLTQTVTSPTLAHQIEMLLDKYPAAQWHQYEPLNRDNLREGARMAFGEDASTYYRFEEANVILALDADFLMGMPGSVRYARDYADKRRVSDGSTQMNRLYAIESTPTITGAKADHRLRLRASQIQAVAYAIAAELNVEGISSVTLPPDLSSDWLQALVRDLRANQGASIVLAGDGQPPVVHALAHAINAALGNVGSTVVHTEPVAANPTNQTASLQTLVQDMNRGDVDVLLILGGNPVYDAPADLDFGGALRNVNLSGHLGEYYNETSAVCHWHLPATHFLEMWGDARAYDGTVTMIQPLIEPLYDGRSAYELMGILLRDGNRSGYDIVRNYWREQDTSGDFERAWNRAIYEGLISGSQYAAKDVTIQSDFAARANSESDTVSDDSNSLEIIFRADPSIWDGRFANNGWLQEVPKPLSKLTWDNAAYLSPTTATQLGVNNEEVVELDYRDRVVIAAVWILPGQPDGSVTVNLGYGRTRAGHVGTGAGFDAYQLRTSDAPWFGTGLNMRKTNDTYQFAVTHTHHSMEGRPLVMSAPLSVYLEDPGFAQTEATVSPEISLFPPFEYDEYSWGMNIDLTSCIGCNACTVACQAENNIPVVGKEEVARGHEMHWIRIDRYYEGDVDAPDETHFQPVPCMHCENAPCELVCPVAATLHDDEGLNLMVYNRCVGTRYCSNNCPYKVRRFNFLQFSDWNTESLKLGRNPDVSVRSRGVMEKCTYCVQRISQASINAEIEGRPIRDGEIQTACQQACPTKAIVFGDINDPNSRLTQLKSQPLDYTLLAELNTRPHTTYLAEVRNPNPEIG